MPAERRAPSDWLSPLLIKELRQSLRCRWFEWVFLALISSLMLLLLLNGWLANSPLFDFLFWAFILLTLHGLLPLRTALAAAEDCQPGNLDLIRMTGISAENLAGQRLTALGLQAAMVAFVILPFLLLRYFMNGLEMVNELQYLLLLVVSTPVVGGVLLWISLSGGCARLLLGVAAFLALPLYETLIANTAFSDGEPAFLLLVLWLLVSFIGSLFVQAMVSEAFLLGRS